MRLNNGIYRREALEPLSTEALDGLLNEELTADAPNGENVRLLLRLLREREKGDAGEPGPAADAAWKAYLRQTRTPDPERQGSRLLRGVAAAAILLVLVLLIPQQASARNFFDRLVRWTDSVLTLRNPDDVDSVSGEYVFRTEHPGLQQVYDTVAALGVTQPVVPTWLPEGYELVELRVIELPTKKRIAASFANGNSEMVLTIDIYIDNITHKYYKDNSTAEEIEFSGIIHNVTKNDGKWLIVWTVENIECSVYMDCREEIRNHILRSIYVMEAE